VARAKKITCKGAGKIVTVNNSSENFCIRRASASPLCASNSRTAVSTRSRPVCFGVHPATTKRGANPVEETALATRRIAPLSEGRTLQPNRRRKG